MLLDCNHVIFYDSVFSDTINGLPFLVDFAYAQEHDKMSHDKKLFPFELLQVNAYSDVHRRISL